MPDLEKIKKHLEAMLQSIGNLEKHKGISTDDLKSDLDLLWILERGIYLTIQNLFDILAHIVSADFDTQWESYSDIAEILFYKKFLDKHYKNLLIQMAGFRNRLSHEYLSLEPNVLVDVVNNRLSDFSKFLLIIKNYCKIN
jgi:uncharacterized protein YutE (UPF0331/DUF86 family)